MKHQQRWSDRDKLIGNRITYYPTERGGWELMLGSGDKQDTPGCKLSIRVPGHGVILWLPAWLKPHAEKVKATYWDAATIERMGRDWYWDYSRREYGFYLHNNHFVVKYGRQADSSDIDKRWSCFLPWGEWRFVNHKYYGLEGQVDAEFPEPDYSKLTMEQRRAISDQRYEFQEKLVERIRFTVIDSSDGSKISGTTYVESRHWKFGTGWFKWLSWFRKDRVSKSLSINFDSEVGNEKGSWKGGLMGTSIEMLPGELHEQAFARYCAQEHRDKGGTYRLQVVD